MRHRTWFLFLLAVLLALPPVVYTSRADSRCQTASGSAEGNQGLLGSPVPGMSTCLSPQPLPLWVPAMGVLAAITALAAGVSLVQALLGRRRERQMLASLGVPVAESDLPLD